MLSSRNWLYTAAHPWLIFGDRVKRQEQNKDKDKDKYIKYDSF